MLREVAVPHPLTSFEDWAPRIYASFAAFEREERCRLGLPPVEELPVVVEHPASRPRSMLRPAAKVTPASLRAEGVLEVGRAPGTSVLFVQTRVKLHLFHMTTVPDRELDTYAVNLAVTWIEDHGMPSCKVALNLGVTEGRLRLALAKAGYERLSPARHDQLARARGARKIGNRRGRLVRRLAAGKEAVL